ncbi:uncharacterized protein, partial [Hetaerina americana]|uniref:uncharacterized protein n=1 Tax=Hetaerina americana TaxID=62018 RepID=UPI003A7F3AAA
MPLLGSPDPLRIIRIAPSGRISPGLAPDPSDPTPYQSPPPPGALPDPFWTGSLSTGFPPSPGALPGPFWTGSLSTKPPPTPGAAPGLFQDSPQTAPVPQTTDRVTTSLLTGTTVSAKRVDNQLVVFFPVADSLGCTEPGCPTSFRASAWTATRRSLLRHLKEQHGLTLTSVNACSTCGKTIGRKPSTHPCLKGGTSKEAEEPEEAIEETARCATPPNVTEVQISVPRAAEPAEHPEPEPPPVIGDFEIPSPPPGNEEHPPPAEAAEDLAAPRPVGPTGGPKEKLWLDRLANTSGQSWEEFEVVVEELVASIQAERKKEAKEADGKEAPRPRNVAHKPPTRRRQVPDYDAKKASDIQKLFRSHPRRAVESILSEKSPYCDIPAEEVEKHFRQIYGDVGIGGFEDTDDESVYRRTTETEKKLLLERVTPEEDSPQTAPVPQTTDRVTTSLLTGTTVSAKRVDNQLVVFFPVADSLGCTEPGCPTSFRASAWTATRRSLLRHLKEQHGLTLTSVNACSICGKTIGRKPSTHPCLKGGTSKEAEEPEEAIEETARCATPPNVTEVQISVPRAAEPAEHPEPEPPPVIGDFEIPSPPPGNEEHPPPAEAAEDLAAPRPVGPTGGPKEKLWLDRLANTSGQSWEEFEVVVEELVASIQAERKKEAKEADGKEAPRPRNVAHKPPTRRRQVPDYDAKKASDIQKLFRSHPRRAVESILSEKSPYCDIPAEEVEKHFRQIYGDVGIGGFEDTDDESVYRRTTETEKKLLLERVTPEEDSPQTAPVPQTTDRVTTSLLTGTTVSAKRVDNQLVVFFPVADSLGCTEPGCPTSFRASAWTATRRSLLRHLKEQHGLTLTSVNACSICGKTIGRKPSTHPCLKGGTSKEAEEPEEAIEETARCATPPNVTEVQISVPRAAEPAEHPEPEPPPVIGDFEIPSPPPGNEEHPPPAEAAEDLAAPRPVGPTGGPKEKLWLDRLANTSGQSWEEFEVVVEELVASIQAERKKEAKEADGKEAPRPRNVAHKPPTRRRQVPDYDAKKASDIQKLFRSHPRRAVESILSEKSPYCDIPAEEVEKHFRQIYGDVGIGGFEDTDDESVYRRTTETEKKLLLERVTPEEDSPQTAPVPQTTDRVTTSLLTGTTVSAKRVDNQLVVFFPVADSLGCTEPGCPTSFRASAWTATRRSLLRHLKEQHGLTLTSVNACSICGKTIGRKPSTHPCLKGGTSKEAEEPEEAIEETARCATPPNVTEVQISVPRAAEPAEHPEPEPPPVIGDFEIPSPPPGNEEHPPPAEAAEDLAAPRPVGPTGGPKEKLWLDRLANTSGQSWEEFEVVVEELVASIQAERKKEAKEADGKEAPRPRNVAHKPPTRRRQVPDYDAKKASDIQKLFRSHPRRAVESILSEKSPYCDIPAEEVEKHFRQIYGDVGIGGFEDTDDESVYRRTTETEKKLLLERVTPEE